MKAAGKWPPLGRGSAGCGASGASSASLRAPVPPQVDRSRRWDPGERGWLPPEEELQRRETCSLHSRSPVPWKSTNMFSIYFFFLFWYPPQNRFDAVYWLDELPKEARRAVNHPSSLRLFNLRAGHSQGVVHVTFLMQNDLEAAAKQISQMTSPKFFYIPLQPHFSLFSCDCKLFPEGEGQRRD